MTSSVAYLDYAATSPMPAHVEQAWVAAVHALSATPGNPSALHSGGRAAKRMLEDARETLALSVGAERAEVVFTSGATESVALGVTGVAVAVRRACPQRTIVYLSRADHDAVAHQEKVLHEHGFDVRFFGLDAQGICIIPPTFVEELPYIAVATMPMVSSEIGTIQPIDALVALRNEAPITQVGESLLRLPIIHTDAAQAFQVLNVNFSKLGVDVLSMGGHKLGAPVGTGALVIRRGIPVFADRPGGGHERGIRSGTPDVAGAVALAEALRSVVSTRAAHRGHLAELRDYLLDRLPEGIQPTVPPTVASPAIVHLSIPTTHPEAVLMAMDMAGVMVSAGSACHANVTRPSDMVMAMGRSADQALGVLRVSMGANTTYADLDRFIEALPAAISAGQRLDQRDQRKREIGSSVLPNAPQTANEKEYQQ